MAAINTKAGGHAKHARTGKDGALYNSQGVLLATIESFTAQVSMNNAQYNVLGNALELETLGSHAITITFSQVVVADDTYIRGLMEFLNGGTPPNWTFQGVLKGITTKDSKGKEKTTEERVIYKNCIPSGQIDIQNIAVGDVVKRNWSFHCNSTPILQKQLTI